jgi:hypothetical protein
MTTQIMTISAAADAYVDAWLVEHPDGAEVCRWCGEMYCRLADQKHAACPACEVILARCDAAYQAAYQDYRRKRYRRIHGDRVKRSLRQQIEIQAHYEGKQAFDRLLVALHPHVRWSTPDERRVYPGAIIKVDCPLVWERFDRLKLARATRRIGGGRRLNFCGEAIAA